MNNTRMHPLDSLRGIAALGVAVFWHYQHFDVGFLSEHREVQPFYNIFEWFYLYGWNLVDFFFVLSGFVFSFVYSKKLIANELSLRNFVVLRLSRLYPLHLATLIFVAVIQYYRVIKGDSFFIFKNNDVYNLLLNLGFIQSGFFDNGGYSFNGPAWSISIEFIAYLIFFYTLTKVKNINRFFVFLVFAGLCLFRIQPNLPVLNGVVSRVIIGFFIGCITFKIHEQIAINKKLKWWLLSVITLLLAIGTVMCLKIGFTKFLGKWEIVMPLVFYPSIILISIDVFIINKLLSLRPLTYLGDISFSVYLLHFPVQIAFNTITGSYGLEFDFQNNYFFIAYVSALLLVSIAVHHLFELPVQQMLRKKYLVKQ